MYKLFNIEKTKVLNYRVAKILIILYSVLLIVSILSLSGDINIFGFEIDFKELGIFNFPDVWHFITYYAAFAKIFLAIIIITTIANEFSYGTLKQNLIDGLSKKEFIASKLVTITVFSLLSTVLVGASALYLGFQYSDNVNLWSEELLYIPAYFLKLMTFFSFCMFLCVLIRKSAFALALLFVWYIFEGLLKIFEMFIHTQIGSKSFHEAVSEVDSPFYITEHLPLSSMGNLIPFPLKRIKEVDMMTMGQMKEITMNYENFVICILYFVLFVWGSYAIIKKRDL